MQFCWKKMHVWGIYITKKWRAKKKNARQTIGTKETFEGRHICTNYLMPFFFSCRSEKQSELIE